MRVLLDHCVPKQFGLLIAPGGHHVRTAHFEGWDSLDNGDLLSAAAARYDAVVTVDRNLRFQQHGGERPIAVLALVAPSNGLDELRPLLPEVLRLLNESLQRRVYVVEPPRPIA